MGGPAARLPVYLAKEARLALYSAGIARILWAQWDAPRVRGGIAGDI